MEEDCRKSFEFRELSRFFCIPVEYLARQSVGGSLETKPELYRRLARECLILRVRLADEGARSLFVVMAAVWQRLAERADHEGSDAFRLEQAGGDRLSDDEPTILAVGANPSGLSKEPL